MTDSRNYIFNETLRALRRDINAKNKLIERLKLRVKAEREAARANRDEVLTYRKLIRKAVAQ